jgi:hypothetical protein
MTTLVYDGKSLVSDSQSSIGSEIYEEDCQKLFPEVGPFAVLGIAGNYQDCMDVIDSIGEYTKVEQIRNLDYEELGWDCGMIGITHDGSVWQYTGKDSFQLRPDLPFALGSGSDYAMGAMYAGADAKTALEAAARYDLYTNNVIQEASLVDTEEEEEVTKH